MNRRRRFIVVLANQGGVSAYTISGTVYDADGSTPVAGATVALGALSAVSGADGTYTISNVPTGTSGSMTCTKTGYSWTAITVSAMSGNLTGQDYDNAWWAGGGCAAICVAAYKPRGAGSLASSYVNLVNPGTNNATVGVAPTLVENGWSSIGAARLGTGITPNQNYSMVAKISGWTSTPQGGNQVMGQGTTGAQQIIIPQRLTSNNRAIYGTVADDHALMTDGVLALCANKVYQNGVLISTISSAFGTPTNAIGLMGINDGATACVATYTKEYAAIYNADASAYMASIYAGILYDISQTPP